MTADILQYILFLILIKACAQINSTPANRKHFPKQGHGIVKYSIYIAKNHKLCSNCALKDQINTLQEKNTLQDLERFQQGTNPTKKYYRIRSARNPVKHKIYDNEFINKRFLVQRSPSILSINKLIKKAKNKIKKYWLGVQPQRENKWRVNYQRGKVKRQKIIPQDLQIKSTHVLRTRSALRVSEVPRTHVLPPPITHALPLSPTPALPLLTTHALPMLTTPALPLPTTPALPLTTKTALSLPIMRTLPLRTTPALSLLTMFALPLSTTKKKTGTKTIIISSDTARMPLTTTITRRLVSKYQEPKTTTIASSSLMKSAEKISLIPSTGSTEKIPLIQQTFAEALDQFERKYHAATFDKLSTISPLDRRANGISFVESGFFLFLILTAMSLEVDKETRSEIDSCLALDVSDSDKIKMIKRLLDNLPSSSEDFKFQWSTRLVINGSRHAACSAEEALRLRIEKIDGNETAEQLLNKLNNMVEQDSRGAMRNTFEEEDMVTGIRSVLINTMYVRARWRAAPTLLNGTRPFRDTDGAPPRTTRMIRVNDIVQYVDLTEWDAEAVEISYATPGLSLFLLVPRGRSLRTLLKWAATMSVSNITTRMRPLRVAVTLPIYTLRMTLLLPNKLQAMGINRLVASTNENQAEFRLSHAVQRIMFWAEAGRNAFKDDGIEWDPRPELEMMVDRPYLFYIRWRNLTLLNGNFVL